jgi:hypothetical protein
MNGLLLSVGLSLLLFSLAARAQILPEQIPNPLYSRTNIETRIPCLTRSVTIFIELRPMPTPTIWETLPDSALPTMNSKPWSKTGTKASRIAANSTIR